MSAPRNKLSLAAGGRAASHALIFGWLRVAYLSTRQWTFNVCRKMSFR